MFKKIKKIFSNKKNKCIGCQANKPNLCPHCSLKKERDEIIMG